uniref:Uncharacterized protein n=1 Tax=Panagrolaimus sp. ES5 TaxID=591445 RepID=A0AC34FB49_9BILA
MGKCVLHHPQLNDSKLFIENIPELFKNVESVMLNVFQYKPNGFKSNTKFCEAVKAKLDSLQIPNYFNTSKNFLSSMFLIAVNINIEFHETVILVMALKSCINVYEYEYTQNGFKEIAEKHLKNDEINNSKVIHDKIMGESNPKKIILSAKINSTSKLLRNALKSKKKKIIYGCQTEKKSIQKFLLTEKCHQNKITFTIDSDNFFEVKHEACIFPEVLSLPEKLNNVTFETKNIPLIAFMNDLSFICVSKNENIYKFSDAWNGEYGNQLIITFKEEKPKCCEAILIAFLNKTKYLVYDLIKIMSMAPENIEINEKWDFEITKDENNPILIEMEIFDGSRKWATPAFLMALLLKQHLKAIKEECGEKPATIGFYFLENLNKEENERVEKQLQEACKLLNIDCVFI